MQTSIRIGGIHNPSSIPGDTMIPRNTLILITVLCIVIALCGVASAEEPTVPVIPQAFFGDVQIVGQAAPVGTTIEIRGTGVQNGAGNPFTVTIEGKFGKTGVTGPSLFAQGNITDGTPLTFWVNSVQARIVTSTGTQDTIPFTSGADRTQVNLQAAAGSPEVTAATTTSPPASGGGGGGSGATYNGGGGGGGGGSYSGFFDTPGGSSGNTTGTASATQVTTSLPAAQKTGQVPVTTVRTTPGPAPAAATSPILPVSPILIGAIVIVITAAVASGGYYMMQKRKREDNKEEKKEEKKEL